MTDNKRTVYVEISKTIQQDAYEPLRITIGLSEPALDGEKANDLIERVYALVEKKVSAKIDENQE